MQGLPPYDAVWGKFTPPERGGPAWHPLADHCTDVALVLAALLAQPTIRRRLARAGGLEELDRVQVARLCFLAFIHDLGKCARGFQAKASERPTEVCGHIKALKGLFAPDLISRFLAAIAASDLDGWNSDGISEMLEAVIAHHGRPKPITLDFDAATDGRLLATWLPRGGDDPLTHLERLVAEGRALFPDAFAAGSLLPTAPPFVHLFAGLLMLADWLGSGATPDLFPFSEAGDGPRAIFAARRAHEALRRIGLDPSPLRDRLARGMPTFASQFGVPPRLAQAAIDALPLPPEGGVVLLESETGSGKTEAALRWATRLLAAGRVDGVFFAVPLRSAAVQLHGRMQRWLDHTFPEGTAEALLAVPGYFRMGEADGGRMLPGAEVQWSDGGREDRHLARWAAEQPKRYAAAAFAVGTIDQALLGVLETAHAHLRAACLVRNLLVVDEVHSSDPYMRRLVERLVTLFRAAGGQVLLMSATLGAETRERLLRGNHRPAPLADAVALPYPLISTSYGSAVPVMDAGTGKRVELELKPWLDDPGSIAATAASAAVAGARVLVLRNTVGAAIATQAALEARLGADHPALFHVGEIVTLHHGRFAAEDRRLLDAAIQRRVGKGGSPGPAVIVATQTVEQSLDVDFDLLLTDLCPIDVLLQRVGRLHRHADRKRPAGFETARCLVLEPQDGDVVSFAGRSRHGIGMVRKKGGVLEGRAYPDVRAIAATRRLIGTGAAWHVPADNRRLVELGTHPEALRQVASELGEVWQRHGQTREAMSIAQGAQALDNSIDFNKAFSTLEFPEAGKVDIATRLGLDDLLLPLDRPIGSPFGATLGQLKIPGWMVLPATWEAIGALDEPRIAMTADGNLALGKQEFIYDRLGLRPVGAEGVRLESADRAAATDRHGRR